MPKKLSKTEFVARALYCEVVNDPNYDFDADPRGWADLMFKRNARAAIRATKQYEQQ